MQKQFEAAGIKTVYHTIYPAETTNFNTIVSAAAAKNPDMWVGGTQTDDAYGQVKSMISLKFSPKFLYLSNGANSPVEFPAKVGAQNTQGIFSCGDWFPNSTANGNKEFIAAYVKQYGGNAYGIDSTSAEAYAAGSAAPAGGRQDGIDRQQDDHRHPAQRHVADGRGQPQLGSVRRRRRARTCWWSGSIRSSCPSTRRAWRCTHRSTRSRTGPG